MILIISEHDDLSTDMVISWLKHFGVKFLRINNNNILDFRSLIINKEINNFTIGDKQRNIQLKDIKGYWYRRGKLSLKIDYLKEQKIEKLSYTTNNYLESEYEVLIEFIYNELHSLKHSIGNLYENTTNKLINLEIAKSCGIDIPPTWIITSKKDAQNLIKDYGVLLTKPMTQAGLFFKNESISFNGQSNIVTSEIIAHFPEYFAPTLFQEYIDKAYELRIFYFNEDMFTSAIFSQMDEMTKIDFRNYNSSRPNRTPPYNLPQVLKRSIIKFMKKIKMKSGSLDILVSKNKKNYFLEVNPIGQFYQVSHPCNFYLEKRIAKYFENGE